MNVLLSIVLGLLGVVVTALTVVGLAVLVLLLILLVLLVVDVLLERHGVDREAARRRVVGRLRPVAAAGAAAPASRDVDGAGPTVATAQAEAAPREFTTEPPAAATEMPTTGESRLGEPATTARVPFSERVRAAMPDSASVTTAAPTADPPAKPSDSRSGQAAESLARRVAEASAPAAATVDETPAASSATAGTTATAGTPARPAARQPASRTRSSAATRAAKEPRGTSVEVTPPTEVLPVAGPAPARTQRSARVTPRRATAPIPIQSVEPEEATTAQRDRDSAIDRLFAPLLESDATEPLPAPRSARSNRNDGD